MIPNLSFSPSVGHLQAGGYKPVLLTFQAKGPTKMAATPAALKTTVIKFPGGSPTGDWDNSATSTGAPASEPQYEIVTGGPKDKGGIQKDWVLKVRLHHTFHP